MSDEGIRSALEQMEAWLADPSWEPLPDAIAEWDDAFHRAMNQANHGPGWDVLIARCHALGRELEARADLISVKCNDLKVELEGQSRGVRALKGYSAAIR